MITSIGRMIIITPKIVLEPETLEVLQRSGRKEQRGAIRKIHDQTATIRLGEFAPSAFLRQKGQIVLPPANALGLQLLRECKPFALGPTEEGPPLVARELAIRDAAIARSIWA
jgi:hypothetical protein